MKQLSAVLTASLVLLACSPADAISADDEYPIDAVLDAFQQVCGNTHDRETISRNAKAGGWLRVEDVEQSAIWPAIMLGRELARERIENGEVSIYEQDVYQNHLSGEHLTLVTTIMKVEGVESVDCQIFDLDEPEALSLAALEQMADWMARQPDDRFRGGGLIGATWTPGLNNNQTEFTVRSIAAGSEAAELVGIAGYSFHTIETLVRD